MSLYDLVIFDCDGVLVDSERLAVVMESRILTEIGWPISEAEVIQRFVGRSSKYMKTEIENVIGRSIDWWTEFEEPIRILYESELTAIDGVKDALDVITTLTCVASSSSHSSLEFKLGLTGLLERFHGRLFSSNDVEHAKPAPDVFLFAASQLDVVPDRCAVIEDSVNGVLAGLAAGMTVFAYAGGVTSASELARDGVTVFLEMRELPGLLARM
ncbi:MAG TPA: HAD family hydrolase [Acidimicrobiales bacterium]